MQVLLLLSVMLSYTDCALTAVPSGAGSSAITRYVAVDGLDTNDGSVSQPWATLQHAADTVTPGTTVVVEDGTYSQTLRITRAGTSTAPVIFTAQHKWSAKLAPGQSAIDGNQGLVVVFSGAAFVTFKDFELVGTPATASALKIDAGTFNSVVGNKIHDVGVSSTTCTSGAAILVADDNEVLAGNWIYNIGPTRSAGFRCNQKHGIYVTKGAGGYIQNNIILNVWQGWAIHLYGTWAQWTISNNTIVNVGDNGHATGGAILMFCTDPNYNCNSNLVTNNIFAQVQYSTFYQNNNLGTQNDYSNNLIYSSGPSHMVAGQFLTNTNTSDPRFVNDSGDANGDYHLRSGSAAIDQGTATGAPATDFDGVPRPQGRGFDIGAYEYKP